MIKRIKLFSMLLCLILSTKNVDAQLFTGHIQGYISSDNWSGRGGDVKVILSSIAYSDTIILNKYTDSFIFKTIPYGVYELRVDANRGKTGLRDHIIEDIPLQSDQVSLDTIVLFSVRTCGDNAQVWTNEHNISKKEPREYYETGELLAEGQYFLDEKSLNKSKSKLYRHLKNGLWKYYFKNGSLSEYRYYDKDVLLKVTAFNENGKLQYYGSYKYCPDGEWLYFDEAGTLLFRMEYINIFGKPPLIRIKYEYWKAFLSMYKDKGGRYFR